MNMSMLRLSIADNSEYMRPRDWPIARPTYTQVFACTRLARSHCASDDDDKRNAKFARIRIGGGCYWMRALADSRPLN